jgi:hypothetical protein
MLQYYRCQKQVIMRCNTSYIHTLTPKQKRQALSQHAKVRRTGRGGMLDVVDARTAADDVPEDAVGWS